MHYPLVMHVLQGAAQLDKVLPDGSFRNEFLPLLEVSDHPREVASVCQLQDNVQLVVVYE